MTSTVSTQVSATLPEKRTFSGKTLFTKFLILIDKICHFIGSTFQYLSSMASFSKKDFNASLESPEISLIEITSQLDKEEPNTDLSPKNPPSNNPNRLGGVVCHLSPIPKPASAEYLSELDKNEPSQKKEPKIDLTPTPKPVSIEKLPELDEKEPTPKKELEKLPTEKKEDICEELDSNPKAPKEETE